MDDAPDWLRQWRSSDGFAELDAAYDEALELRADGDDSAARDAFRSLFERAVVAPELPDGWLAALAGDYERVLGSSREAVVEATAVLRRAESALAPMHDRARRRALSLRVRFIVDASSLDGVGPAALVTLADFADETVASFGDLVTHEASSDDEMSADVHLARLDRARVDIGVRIREFTTTADVYAAYRRSIAAWDAHPDAAVRLVRVGVEWDAADFARMQGDLARAAAHLEQASAAGRAASAPARMLRALARERIDVDLAAEVPIDDIVASAVAFGETAHAQGRADADLVEQHGLVARAVGVRLRGVGRSEDARSLEDRLLLRFVTSPDPATRAAAVRELRRGADGADPDADASGVGFTTAERDALRRAASAFEADDHPAVRAEVDATMLRWATADVHLGEHRAGLDVLDRLFHRIGPRIIEQDPAARRQRARGLLVSHFAHVGTGDTGAALTALAAVAAETVASDQDRQLRPVRAEAAYWRSRLLHERGDRAGARAVREALLAEFAHDEDGEVRAWASGVLLSLWIAERDGDRDERRRALERHGELFSGDAHHVIREREVRRRTAQARDLRESGDLTGARAMLDALLADVVSDGPGRGPDEHPSVVAAAAEARDLRAILDVLDDSAAPPPGERGHTGPTMAEIDAITTAGADLIAADPAAAVVAFTRAADLAAGSGDPYVRLAGIVALDNLTNVGLRAGDIPGVVTAAERMARECDELLTTDLPPVVMRRVNGERALALQRWAAALGRVGDIARALHLYGIVIDAVDPSRITDDDHIAAISLSMYNRAVLLDERGDLVAAADAYGALIAAHRYWPDSVSVRLRLVKAHRNRGEVFERLGRLSEATDAHRAAVDLARVGGHPDLRPRLADSLARFAELGLRAGIAQDVVPWLDWALGGGAVLERAEMKRLTALRGDAVKAAKRSARRSR